MDGTSWRGAASATASLAAGAALAYCTKECLRPRRFKEPGRRMPFGLGHLHMLNIKNLPWELERLRGFVSDKIMALWLGPDYLVYVTSPALTHKVFVEHGDKSSGRSAKVPYEMGNKGIVLNEGEPWKKNRQLILRELIASKDRTTVVGKVFDELTEKVGVAAGKSPVSQLPEFGDLVHRSVAAGMCLMIFGFRVEEQLLDEILRHVDYLGAKSFDYMMMIRIPFYRCFRLETVLKFESTCRRMLEIVDGLIERRDSKAQEKEAGGILSNGRSQRRAQVDAAASNESIKSLAPDPYLSEVLFEAIQGGLDTTVAVMEWCIAYLADTPAFQKRIHQEMDSICDLSGPRFEDRPKLILLNAAIMETLRMAQISSLVVPHKATQPINLDNGYPQIPNGATLLWSFTEMHGDEKLWGDPWVFRPDRFIDDFPGLDMNPNKGLTETGEFKKYLPFGIGPRHCPGYHLATYELYIGLSKLLWEFEFSSVDKIDLSHHTESIPVRVRGFVPTVRRRVKTCS